MDKRGGVINNLTETSLGVTLDDEYPINEPLSISVLLLGDQGIPNQEVTLIVKFSDQSTLTIPAATDANGEINTSIPANTLIPGETTITAIYDGTSEYTSSAGTETTIITTE